jgi:antitoxin component HigA of HigAB toxin-antitoxin module
MIMLDKIRNQEQYEAIMKMIEKYIQKATKAGGFHSLDKHDEKELHRLTLLANDFEKKLIRQSSLHLSLNGIVQHRLDEMKINQTTLAKLLNTTGSKISKILSGKQEPDIYFLKAIHEKLGIDGNLLLEVI